MKTFKLITLFLNLFVSLFIWAFMFIEAVKVLIFNVEISDRNLKFITIIAIITIIKAGCGFAINNCEVSVKEIKEELKVN